MTNDSTQPKPEPAQVEVVMMDVVPAAKRLVRRSRRVTVTVLDITPVKRAPPALIDGDRIYVR